MQLTDELKQSMKVIQTATEKMVHALKRITSGEDYVQMLHWLYEFYAPLEAQIRGQLTVDIFPDIIRRSRADYILWDIMEFNPEKPKPEHYEQPPVIDSWPRALGALYVLEIGTLGGRVITGMLSHQLNTTKGFSFFNSYGAETARMWQSFKNFLNRSWSPDQRREIIAGAEDTFGTFKNFVDKRRIC